MGTSIGLPSLRAGSYFFLLTTYIALFEKTSPGDNSSADPDNRRDFPGGFPGDARNAFAATGRTPEEQDVFSYAQSLLAGGRTRTAISVRQCQSRNFWAAIYTSRWGLGRSQ